MITPTDINGVGKAQSERERLLYLEVQHLLHENAALKIDKANDKRLIAIQKHARAYQMQLIHELKAQLGANLTFK
jgi:hypothetical protein